MKKFRRRILIAMVPLAVVVLPVRFEVAVSLLFAGVFVVAALSDYLLAADQQHVMPREPKARKSWRSRLGLAS